jgi:hypothetical protein
MAIESPTSFAGRAGVLGAVMMRVRISLISADRRVLAGCLGYLEHGARPVLESWHGSLGAIAPRAHQLDHRTTRETGTDLQKRNPGLLL